MAYEFEMRWKLWSPVESDFKPSEPSIDIYPQFESIRLDTLWKLQPATIKILGFGPQFDDATFEQNGHIRIDFGLDTPWLADNRAPSSVPTAYSAASSRSPTTSRSDTPASAWAALRGSTASSKAWAGRRRGPAALFLPRPGGDGACAGRRRLSAAWRARGNGCCVGA